MGTQLSVAQLEIVTHRLLASLPVEAVPESRERSDDRHARSGQGHSTQLRKCARRPFPDAA